MSLLRQTLIYFAAMTAWSVFCAVVRLPPAIHYGAFGLIVGWYWFTPSHPTPTKGERPKAAA